MDIVKIGFSGGGLGHASGAEEAPEKIISKLNELFANEEGKTPKFNFVDVSVNNSNIVETNENIFNTCLKLNNKSVILGGDHSITYSSFKAFVKKNPGAGFIVFDAHPDCENNFSPPTQEDYLRVLIDEGYLDPNKVIIIGIRNWDKKEIDFLNEKRIKYYTMDKIMQFGVIEVCDIIIEVALSWPSFYLSIDIDAVDPAFAPGTGYIEPGGLSSRELIYFIQRLKKMKNHLMSDIVEISPRKDVNELTVKLGAKLIMELF